jgi:3-deoxy-D-manno-octulosonate 8-phosphate phosphatase (KDO 8-P phosphatase)
VSDELTALASRVEALLLDADGVLTDGGLYSLSDGTSFVRFDIKDGLGLQLASQAGILVGFVSGRQVPQVEARAKLLGIDEVHLGVRDKRSVVLDMLSRHDIAPERACYVGDDLLDLEAMQAVGLPVAVADAVDAVKRQARYVTTRRGGHGAVREVADWILAAKK